jgi:hypothetical protein
LGGIGGRSGFAAVGATFGGITGFGAGFTGFGAGVMAGLEAGFFAVGVRFAAFPPDFLGLAATFF